MPSSRQRSSKDFPSPLGKRPPHVPYSSPPLSPTTDSIYSTDDYPLPSSPFHAHSTAWSTRSGYPISLTGLERSTIGVKEDDSYTISTRGSLDRAKSPPFSSDDDLLSLTSSPTPTPMDQGAAYRCDNNSKMDPIDPIADDVTESSRISVLGPKMRFVSRAPWEADEEDVPEETEDDFIGASDALSVISGKLGGWKFKEEKASIKALAFAGLRSATPTASSSSNKDSFSIGRKTQEFEREVHSSSFGEPPGIKARNVYESSPRSSMSGTECTSTYSMQPTSIKVLREERGPVLPSDSWSPASFSRPFRGQAASHQREQSPFRSSSPTASNRYCHPYANPDVVPTSESPTATPRTSHDASFEDHTIPGVRHSSESKYPTGRDSSSIRKFSAPEPVVQNFSSCSPLPLRDDGVDRPSQGFAGSQTAGWPGSTSINDKIDVPIQNLISLEQAQARMRGQRAQPSANSITPPRSTPAIPTNFSTPPLMDTVSTRHRTMSTGATGKRSGGTTGGAPIDSEGTPPKTLKHKRSAFMKLFGKDKDKDKDMSRFGISTPDPIVRATSTPPRFTPADMDIPPVPELPNFKRAVPPPLVISAPSMPIINGQSLVDSPTIPPSPRLRPPKTETSVDSSLNSNTRPGRTTLDAPNHVRPGANDTLRSPASAPPIQTEFEGLTLRPVSTFFSAKFSDLLAPLSSPPDTASGLPPPPAQEGVPTLDTSRSNSISTASDYPITPNHVNNSTHDLTSSVVTIASLQEQISNMRKIHQRRIWELEGQVRDLKEENERLRNIGECETCGQARKDRRVARSRAPTVSVVDRPKPKIAAGGARSVFG